MAFVVERLAEPIPGYRLLERIGAGGFGEVWKAEAPGGILKAIKFVHGNVNRESQDEFRVQQEMSALNRVKAVRHPFILSLERIDVIDGRLTIVMELADRNLWDRYRECRALGLPGIPREELLRYLEEAAEALDLMNLVHQLQHLDIKPQNLFLVHQHVKVGDFGLVTDTEGVRSQLETGVTPVYAAPETFDGVITRFSDQYNLAVVYMELLTGHRPYSGTNAHQMLMSHLNGSPDLTTLPESDRAPIGRALSQKPEDRYPSCRDLAQALRAGSEAAAPVRETKRDTRLLRTTPTLHDPQPRSFAPLPEPGPKPAPNLRTNADGVLFPALVVGLGGVGLSVLMQLRREMIERWGSYAVVPNIRLLHIDADPTAAAIARQGDTGPLLDEKEILQARLERPAQYLRPIRGQRVHDRWLDANLLCRLPRDQVVPSGVRSLGRLAFVENYEAIRSRLQAELEACTKPEALEDADRQTNLGVRSQQLRVYVVTGLAGGAGSGMFLDLGYAIRRELQRQGYEQPDVVGLFLVPTIDRENPDDGAYSNSYAALVELASFSSGVSFSAFYHDGAEVTGTTEAPFGRCLVLPMTKPGVASDVPEAVQRAGDFLCRDLTTTFGRIADLRRQALAEESSGAAAFGVASFGACRLSMPRRAMIRQAAKRLRQRLVQSWLTTDFEPLREPVAAWIAEQLDHWENRPEVLTRTLQAACEQALGQAPEIAFQQAIDSFANDKKHDVVAAIQALARLDELVGKRPTARPEDARRGLLEQVLDDASQNLLAAWGQRVADVCLSLLEEPRFRLAGAEMAARGLMREIELALQAQVTPAQTLPGDAAQAYQRIHALIFELQKNTGWLFRSKAKPASELIASLQQYAHTRYQELLVQRLLMMYRTLLDALPSRLKDVDLCRARVAELARLLERPSSPRLPTNRTQTLGEIAGRQVFPFESRNLEEAVSRLHESVTAPDLLHFDENVQAAIRREFQSLAHACVTSVSSLKDLKTTMQTLAEELFQSRLGRMNVATVYLSRAATDDAILSDLVFAFDEARPELIEPTGPAGPEMCILGGPGDAAGQRFRLLACRALPQVELVPAEGADDIIFYRELPRVPLAKLPQLSEEAREAYRRMFAHEFCHPHSRFDIRDWIDFKVK